MNISRKGVGLLVALVAIIFLVVVYVGYQWHTHTQTMSRQISSMTAKAQTAGPGATTAEKIRVLEELQAEKDQFSSEGMSEKARQTYERITADIRKAVAASYAKDFGDTSLPNLEEIDDPAIVAGKIIELEKQREQVQQQAAALNDSAITDKMLSQIGDRLEKYNSRKTVIEEDKRRAEEEARRKAEEEAARKAQEAARIKAEEQAQQQAEETARKAVTHYENRDFTIDFPDEWAGKWSVGLTHATDYGATYLVTVSGVAQNPSGGGGDSVVLACGGEPLSNPLNKFVGTLSNGKCDVYVRHEFGFSFIGESSGMGAAQLTIK